MLFGWWRPRTSHVQLMTRVSGQRFLRPGSDNMSPIGNFGQHFNLCFYSRLYILLFHVCLAHLENTYPKVIFKVLFSEGLCDSSSCWETRWHPSALYWPATAYHSNCSLQYVEKRESCWLNYVKKIIKNCMRDMDQVRKGAHRDCLWIAPQILCYTPEDGHVHLFGWLIGKVKLGCIIHWHLLKVLVFFQQGKRISCIDGSSVLVLIRW